jgi:hypothetical protein
VTGIPRQALILGGRGISLGIGGAFDRSQNHHRPKTTKVSLILRAQGIPGASLMSLGITWNSLGSLVNLESGALGGLW